MMKKIVSILLIVAMSLSLLVGCGEADDNSETTSVTEKDSVTENDSATEVPSLTEDATDAPSVTEEPTETELDSEIATEEPTESESEAPTESESQKESETPAPSESESEAPAPSESETPITYTYTSMNKTMYAKASVNVRSLPSTDGDKLGSLSEGEEVTVTGKCNETGWYRIQFKGKEGFVSSKYLTTEKPVQEVPSDNTGNSENNSETQKTDTEPVIKNDRLQPGTYIVNGYELRYEENMTIESYEVDKMLAEAGPYVIVQDYDVCYMLIEDPDDRIKYTIQMEEYIRERGGRPSGGSGNYSDIYVPGEEYPLYLLKLVIKSVE